MKLRHPVKTAFVSGLLGFFLIYGLFSAFGFYVMHTAVCHVGPGEPCDGPVMAFMAFETSGFVGGLLVGAITAFVTGISTHIKNRKAIATAEE